jgi:ABC-2 type transport system ATP-binding protein
MPPVVEARGLTRCFEGLTAVDHLDLEVAEGEIFGLVGPDGAGKTTTLRMLCGLLDPTEGEARVAGHDVVRETRAVKDCMGYMAQRLGLYPDLTVDENMVFYAEIYGIGRARRDEMIPPLLRMTRMEPFRARQAGKLSGGMRQKLGLMCSLLHRPKILLLDEPTTGVDPVSRRDFWAILYQLIQEGMSVFLSTAYLDEAERCHRVGLLHQGRMICCGSPEALRGQMEEVCYEVRTPDLRAARQALQSAAEVLCVESAGPVLHLFLAPSAAPDVIQRKLGEHGITGAAVRTVEPSLEDMFIALVRKAQKQ